MSKRLLQYMGIMDRKRIYYDPPRRDEPEFKFLFPAVNPVRETNSSGGAAAQYITSIGIEFDIKRARNLKAMDRGGKSDPFATVSVDRSSNMIQQSPNGVRKPRTFKAQQVKTKVVKKTLSPTWNQVPVLCECSAS